MSIAFCFRWPLPATGKGLGFGWRDRAPFGSRRWRRAVQPTSQGWEWETASAASGGRTCRARQRRASSRWSGHPSVHVCYSYSWYILCSIRYKILGGEANCKFNKRQKKNGTVCITVLVIVIYTLHTVQYVHPTRPDPTRPDPTRPRPDWSLLVIWRMQCCVFRQSEKLLRVEVHRRPPGSCRPAHATRHQPLSSSVAELPYRPSHHASSQLFQCDPLLSDISGSQCGARGLCAEQLRVSCTEVTEVSSVEVNCTEDTELLESELVRYFDSYVLFGEKHIT